MAEAVILPAIHKLESWAVVNMQALEKYSVCSVEPMKEIFDELRMMADFLRDKKLGEGSKLNYLIGDVVEMVQDIVSIHEYHIFRVLTNEITVTRDWVRETRMRMIKLGVDEEEPLIITTENVGEGDEEEVVGLEEDVQVLLRRAILNEKERLRLGTLVVKGMAGIGKTALARQVYNHEAVVGRFKCRAWLCLSGDLTNKEVLMNLMQQVVGSEELRRDSLLEKMEHADNQSLQEMLRQQLQGMPYFIVADNVPKGMRYLKSVVKCLSNGDKASRLMLTSRSQDYVKIMFERFEEPIGYIHEMKALDSKKSWQLFLKTINKFRSDEEQYKFPKHLEKKGKEMMTKVCGGLPVAIIDVGRQKAKQRLEKGIEWEELLEIDSTDLSASLELLESSYRELDEELQASFMYVAFFKENAIIRAKKLEQIWVAAGEFSDVMSFMYGLARNSFVEIVDKGTWRIRNCRINPLLHRLSIKIAEEEMGFEILRNFNGDSNGANSQSHHRVIHCSRDNKFNHYYSTVTLVSLIFHGGGACLDNANWKMFELLKILDLEDFGLKILSETIGTTLMELKYLGLRNNYIQEIPRSLGCLKNLEVLDIAHNFMVEVPDIIWEMGSLCHLHMSDVICAKPLKIQTLEHLETLAYISIYNVLGLEKMTRLKKMGVEEVDENSDVSKLFESLARLENISCLTLRGFCFRSMPCLDEVGVLVHLRILKLDGLLAGLPSADIFPPMITELSFVNSSLDEDPMPVLGKLTHLTHLKLRNAYTSRQMVIREKGFLYLTNLRIKDLWNLRNMQVAENAMRFLGVLEIENCPYLESLPEKFGSRNLEELKMVTTKNIATKIRKSGLISKIMVVDITP